MNHFRLWLFCIATLLFTLCATTAIVHAFGGWTRHDSVSGRWRIISDGSNQEIGVSVWYSSPNIVHGPVLHSEGTLLNQAMRAWEKQTPAHVDWDSRTLSVNWSQLHSYSSGPSGVHCDLTGTAVHLAASDWLVEAVLLVVSVFVWNWARRLRKYADPSRNLCSRCGYDLRATPDRCPECGMGQAKPA
jgi:hypothetical protein